jgi:hypothetical protein
MIGSGLIRQIPSSGSFKGPLAPIVVSIVGVIGWLVFILLYALFWSKGFSLFQNLTVTVASLLIVGLVIGLVWVVWGFRGGWRGWMSFR